MPLDPASAGAQSAVALSRSRRVTPAPRPAHRIDAVAAQSTDPQRHYSLEDNARKILQVNALPRALAPPLCRGIYLAKPPPWLLPPARPTRPARARSGRCLGLLSTPAPFPFKSRAISSPLVAPAPAGATAAVQSLRAHVASSPRSSSGQTAGTITYPVSH